MSSLGKLTAAVALDAAEFIVGADKAKYVAAQLATDVDKSLRGLESSIKGTMGSIAGALVAGFGIAALKSQFDAYAEGAAKMGDLAAKAGLTVEKFSGIAAVAKISGTSMDELASAMAKLDKGMVTSTGTTAGAGKAMDFLKISAYDSGGRLRDAGTITELVAQKLATMADGAGKTAIMMDLYGKTGANLIPMMKDLAEFGVKNATITEQQAKVAKDYEQNLVRLGIAKSGLVKIISSEVLPVADAFVMSLLDLSTKTGGLRDKTKELAADGSIRQFAMIGVQSIGFLINIVDGAKRTFEAFGEFIGFLAARAVNTLGTIADAAILFIRGEYTAAWQELKDGSARDAALVNDHAQSLRDKFEKPLAGDVFVKSVEDNLAKIDAKMAAHKKTVTGTADGYKEFGENAKKAGDAADALADSLGKSSAKLQVQLDSLVKYGVAYKETALAAAQYEVTEGKVAKALADRKKYTEEEAAAIKASILQDAARNDGQKESIDLYTKYIEAVKAHTEAVASGVETVVDEIQKEKDKIATFGKATDAVTAYTIAQLELKLAQLRVIEGADLEVKAMETKIAKLRELQGYQAQYKDLEQTSGVLNGLVDKAVQFGVSLASGVKNARDQFKQWVIEVAEFFAKKYLLQMVASASGGGSVVGSAANASLGGMENSLTGVAVNAASTYLFGSAGTATAGGMIEGYSSGVIGTGGFAATVGAGAETLATGMGVAAEGAAAFGEAVAAAIPVIGWIVAIAAVLYMAFGSKGGAPKGGGSFNGSFDAQRGLRGLRRPAPLHAGPERRATGTVGRASPAATSPRSRSWAARRPATWASGSASTPTRADPRRTGSRHPFPWAAATSSPARTATSGATRARSPPRCSWKPRGWSWRRCSRPPAQVPRGDAEHRDGLHGDPGPDQQRDAGRGRAEERLTSSWAGIR
jgi:hypothetical protein